MPSGKVHDNVAFVSILPVFFLGSCVFNFSLSGSILFTFLSTISQLMFGPDLDTVSYQYKRWGFLKWIWLPYRLIFKHRSRFSHGILFGPLLRGIYFIFVLLFLAFFLDFIFYKFTGISLFLFILLRFIHILHNVSFNSIKHILMPVIAGIFFGAAIHTITDKLASFIKNIL